MIDSIYNTGLQLSGAPWWTGAGWPVVWGLVKIVCVVVPLLVAVAYMTLWERKLLGYMQVRQGPNRVGPWGLWQPFADGIKLLTKELIQPTQASQRLFWLGPVLAIMPALAAWVAVPFAPHMAVANIDAGLLLILAITSIEVYGVIIAGWASNSKYAMLGALRASAQMVSYEIAMGFCFLVVIMVTGSLNMTEIVLGQGRGAMAGMGLGLGIIISSLTTKYRDFNVLIGFAIQLLMYATPVAYPLSFLKDKPYAAWVAWNPLSPIVESFRYALFGTGTLDVVHLIYSAVFIIIVLFLGMLIFSKVERTFMDTV